MSKVEFHGHGEEALDAMQAAVRRALWAIGATAEGHAKSIITHYGRVDTGRMRNSVAHLEDGDSVYIGTNVEYAPYHEYGTSKIQGIHFLQKAATNYSKEYKELLKDSMENA